MRQIDRYFLVCALQFLLVATLFGEDLRIATYNLNNYLVMDRHVGGYWRPGYPKPANEKVAIHQVIKEASPDILVLQEIGSVDFLEELRSDLGRAGLRYDYAVHMQAADPVRHLALLSKRPPQHVVKHTDLDFKYFDGRETVKRGMLEMTFDLGNGQTFQLFAVHLKSRFTDNKEDEQSALRRAREAEACRNRIIERTIDRGLANYMVVGDFNDHPASSTMRRFYSRGDLEIGSRVPAADSRGEVWTYFYEKESRYESVDGIVASPAMMRYIKAGQAQIVDTPGALSGSDHRMVYLDLTSGEQGADAASAASLQK